MAKQSATRKKPMTELEILTRLSNRTGLTKGDVIRLLDCLSELIGENLDKQGPGVFIVPGLMKIKVNRKPAVEARKGIHPFTKEETVFQAQPARNIVKILPLKALKAMV